MKQKPTIGSVMTPFPHFIGPEANLNDARAMMDEHRIRHLAVQEGNELVGEMSDRDIRHLMDPDGELPDHLTVGDIMVSEPYVVESDAVLEVVLQEMADNHYGCTLVVKKGSLVGIFTTTDACRLFAEHLAG